MKTCNATNLNACLPTRALTCSNENKKQQPFDTHHVSYTVYPTLWKSHDTTPSKISHHTPPFSSHQVICNPLASTSPCLVDIHHWHAVSSCRLLLSLSPSQTERNSLWLFPFFFFLQRSERQLLWWWDTKTALAANVHEWEEHWGWVCECVRTSVVVCPA